MNRLTAYGQLGKDPELRFTQSGRAVCGFSLATEHRVQRNNEWVSETTWFDCTVWGDLGENIAQTFHKGDRVVAYGRIQQRHYEIDAPDGTKIKRSVLEFIVEELGASLRFATAVVTKVNKTADSNSQPKDEPIGDEEPF